MTIPKKASQLKKAQSNANVYLTDLEQKFLGVLSFHENYEVPYVTLKYFQTSYECFSVWQESELKAFINFVEKLRRSTWADIYKTSGKLGVKTGFGYTPHKNKDNLPKIEELNRIISPDITYFELRITDKARVHGFRVKEAFFLVWLDREHKINPM